MSHLNPESLARLVDEAPGALDAAHLAACAQCREELQAMHEQTAQLGALPALQPPPEDWAQLEQRLRDEGLIRPEPALARSRRRTPWLAYAARAAAAVALFAVGTLAGRTLQPRNPAVAEGTRETPVIHATSPAYTPDPAPRVVPAEDPGRTVAPVPPRRLTAATPEAELPRSAGEALAALQGAENDYLAALARFAELSGSTRSDDPTARLAALEGIVLTTRAALAQAPTDPVINGYHLTALAQRDATLRQIADSNTDSW